MGVGPIRAEAVASKYCVTSLAEDAFLRRYFLGSQTSAAFNEHRALWVIRSKWVGQIPHSTYGRKTFGEENQELPATWPSE
jgi:hypothetical protein